MKALIEEAKENSCDMKKSLGTLFRAMNICVKYHLQEESILIVKSDIYWKSILNAIEQGLSQYCYSKLMQRFRRRLGIMIIIMQ